MGIPKIKAGQDMLGVWKKEQVSWEEVIKEARLFNYSPKDVSKLINAKFLKDFYGDTSFLTFACCAVYHKALSKEKSNYAAQKYVIYEKKRLKSRFSISMHNSVTLSTPIWFLIVL